MIVFDLDGVLVDFVTAANVVHNRADYVPRQFNYYEDWGLTAAEFWRPIDAQGPAFWSDIPTFSWTDSLIRLGQDCGDVLIATTPSRCATSTAGKVAAIQRLFTPAFRDYAITPRKWLLGAPGRLLIDDLEENCERFAEAGGDAILFPQPWNANHYMTHRRLEFVGDQLTELGYA